MKTNFLKSTLLVAMLSCVTVMASNLGDSQKMLKAKEIDAKLVQTAAIKDFKNREKFQKSDGALAKFLKSALAKHRSVNCDDDSTDVDIPVVDPIGERSCWDKCSDDGWSVSYCENLCGTDSAIGEKNCWEQCSDDGWSVSYCSDKCGTDSNAGEKNCWDACSDDGWSVSYCSDKCGTGSNAGVRSCWDACSEDGWSVSYCNDKCGKED